MTTKEQFSANLKALRMNRKLSQQKVADAISISRSAYSSYELNKAEPSLDGLIQISRLFNVSLDTLIRREITFISEDHTARMDGTRMLVGMQLR